MAGLDPQLFDDPTGFSFGTGDLPTEAEVIATINGNRDGLFLIPEGTTLFNGRGVTGDVRVGFLRGNEQSWDTISPNGQAMLGQIIDMLVPSQVEDIPEPATMALLGLAACGLGGYVRRRRSA